MPRKPLSKAAKAAFIRSRKLYWIRKKMKAEENGLKITAPMDSSDGRWMTGKEDWMAKGGLPIEPLGEEEFEREMEIRWKREE